VVHDLGVEPTILLNLRGKGRAGGYGREGGEGLYRQKKEDTVLLHYCELGR
jgi:hypothetical protein